MFTDYDIVADVAVGLFTVPTEILRVGTDDGTLINFAVLTDACAVDDTCLGHDYSVVSDLHVCIYVGERIDGYVFTDYG